MSGEKLTELDRVDRGRGDFESDFSISRGVGQKRRGSDWPHNSSPIFFVFFQKSPRPNLYDTQLYEIAQS